MVKYQVWVAFLRGGYTILHFEGRVMKSRRLMLKLAEKKLEKKFEDNVKIFLDGEEVLG